MMDEEIIKEEAREKLGLFFRLQSQIENTDNAFHRMEELIEDVTSKIEVYREFRKHMVIEKVLNFYVRIKNICTNIEKSIIKAEFELQKLRREENWWKR